MGSYNHLLANHFAGHDCLLAVKDTFRNRTLRVFDFGDPDVVGISDGTDSWVTSPNACFFDYDLRALLNAKVAPRGNTHPQTPTRRVITSTRAQLRA